MAVCLPTLARSICTSFYELLIPVQAFFLSGAGHSSSLNSPMYFQVPKICISPAPPQEPTVEPYSPFSFIPQLTVHNDNFRPVLLTPPPSVHRFGLGGATDGSRGIGLESQRFQQLLNAVRERKASVSLRKDLAVNIHKNRQVERRALFLSKLQATDTMAPTTPLDSPPIFHYSISSPGLMAPFPSLESVDKDNCEGWVENAYFDEQGIDTDLTKNDNSLSGTQKSKPRIPSLEQISARMMPPSINPSEYDGDSASVINAKPSRTRPLIGVGRLRMPQRNPQPHPQGTLVPPLQPSSQSKSRVTTVIENTVNSISSNTNLTETKLNAFNVRGQKAHDMLCTLRKRTSPIGIDEDGKFKRHSAPAEMTSHPRAGFAHPVLAMPGSF